MPRGRFRTVTHCKHGHEFTTENTRIKIGPKGEKWKICIQCWNEYNRSRFHTPAYRWWNRERQKALSRKKREKQILTFYENSRLIDAWLNGDWQNASQNQ